MTTRTRQLIYLAVVVGAVTAGSLAFAAWRQGSGVPAAVASVPDAALVAGDVNAATFRDIAARRMPMVVSIRTLRRSEARPVQVFGNDALRQFFGLPDGAVPRERVLEGAGSGFIISPDGLVLTNNHVVQDATRIQVALFPNPEAAPGDVRRLDARVLGRDPLTDSALLQVDGRQLPTAALGNSDSMRPGDLVMAIGNPFALSHTVTIGVVSATARPFPLEGRPQRVLQTDAAINPGNSGGPLLNLRGEVIGVTTAIFSPAGAAGGNVGIGFAIPINLIRDLIPQLREGDVKRGRLGISVRSVPERAADELGLQSPDGALVAAVEADGPAERAGLEPGDVIVGYRGERIETADELVSLVSNTPPSTSVPLAVMRGGSERTVTVTLDTLGETKDSAPAAAPDLSRAFGLSLQAVPPELARARGLSGADGGALVAEVMPGSAAEESGVEEGDVILEVNRKPVSGLPATTAALHSVGAGQSAFLLVQRERQRIFLVLTRPD